MPELNETPPPVNSPKRTSKRRRKVKPATSQRAPRPQKSLAGAEADQQIAQALRQVQGLNGEIRSASATLAALQEQLRHYQNEIQQLIALKHQLDPGMARPYQPGPSLPLMASAMLGQPQYSPVAEIPAGVGSIPAQVVRREPKQGPENAAAVIAGDGRGWQ